MPQSSSTTLRALVPAGVATLLALLLLQLSLTARRNSITWDEDDHIYASYTCRRNTGTSA